MVGPAVAGRVGGARRWSLSPGDLHLGADLAVGDEELPELPALTSQSSDLRPQVAVRTFQLLALLQQAATTEQGLVSMVI